MADEAALIEIVGQLYEAAADASAFSALPAVIAAHFETDSTMIHTCAPQSLQLPAVLAATKNFDSWAQSSYVDHYHYVNTWFQRGIRKPMTAHNHFFHLNTTSGPTAASTISASANG
jgi:hypothetical protein